MKQADWRNLFRCTCGVLIFATLALVTREPSLEGSVARVDTGRRELVVRTPDGSTHRFRLPAGAVVRSMAPEERTQQETLSAIQPGMDVEVYYSRNTATGTAFGPAGMAVEVDALPPGCHPKGTAIVCVLVRDTRGAG